MREETKYKLNKLEKNKITMTLLEELAEISLSKEVLNYLFKKGRFSLVKDLMKLYEYEKHGEKITRYFFDPITEDIPTLVKESELLSNDEKQEFLDLIYKIDLEKIGDIKIKHVHARAIIGVSHPIEKEEDVIHYFELPNIKAGLELYDKNIETLYNDTANCFNDTSGDFDYDFIDQFMYTNIRINYKSLSDENKKVAEKLINEGSAFYNNEDETIDLVVHTNMEDSVKDISDKMLKLTNNFKKQDLLYKAMTLEELYQKIENEIEEATKYFEKDRSLENMLLFLKGFSSWYPYYYDPVRNLFFEHENYFKRQENYEKTKKKIS